MAAVTDTVGDATKDVQDAGKSLLGNRKPTDITQGELEKATPKQVAGVVGEAVKQGENSGEKPSSLKIHIKLDLDVEVHLTARVKGDITIGLL